MITIKSIILRFIAVTFLLVGAMVSALAQCEISDPSDMTGCSGWVTFNAVSNSSTVSGHYWYDQNMNQLTPTSQSAVPDNFGGQWKWVSSLTVSLSSNATFYVAASCNAAVKQSVTFTVNNGSPIGLAMSPGSNPADLCAGETITLTASGGSNYQWRYNDPNSPSYTGSTTYSATQSGTYYLTGTPACGPAQQTSITLNFKQPMASVAISGPGTVCAGRVSDVFTAAGSNIESVNWSISDNDPNASASISNGVVNWNGVSGQVTVSMTAWGCHSTNTPVNKVVTITPLPTQSQCAILSTNSLTACSGSSRTLSAMSTSSYVKSHKWFTSVSGGTQVSVTQGSQAGGGAWVSEFTSTFTSNVTYWVEPQCDCGVSGTRVPVSFTVDPGTILSSTMSPASNPADMCQGESVTLNAGGGSNYQWRLNDPNKASPDWSSSSITVNQSGTYYLRGTNSCGVWLDGPPTTFNFKTPLSGVSLSGPDAFCQSSPNASYSVSGFGVESIYWSVSDTDPSASATISTSGMVTWNNIATNATVSATAYGCHGTTVPLTKNVTVTRTPYNVQVSTSQPNFCSGTVATTQFNPSGNSLTHYTWTVSGSGNSISSSGLVTWGPTFSGSSTIQAIAHGCNGSQVPATKSLTVYAKPSVSTSPVSTASIPFRMPSVALTATSGTATSYQWLKNDAPVATGTAATLNATTSGAYTIRVTDANSCQNTSAPPIIVSYASNYNYILENILLSDKTASGSVINENDIRNLDVSRKQEKIQYLDGLGNTLQTVVTKGSPTTKDIVQPVRLDAFGRETVRYLPFTHGTDGSLKELMINPSTGSYQNEAQAFYAIGSNNKIADDVAPTAKSEFENSPLNRILKQGNFGSDWQTDGTSNYTSNDHSVRHAYESNTTDEVLKWVMSDRSDTYPFGFPQATTTSSSTTRTYYTPGTLTKKKVKGENDFETIEYRDFSGKLILKRVQVAGPAVPVDDIKFASTYYIYDDLDNLVCVIPPQAVKQITQLTSDYFGKTQLQKFNFLKQWAFLYKYDYRHRLILKQVPGADSVRMVYDLRDRLVFCQDGNQRLGNKWMYTKYDKLNRPIITGECTLTSNKTQREMSGLLSATVFAEEFNGNATTHGYTNNVFPAANFASTVFVPHTINYYDNYSYLPLATTLPSADAPYLNTHLEGQYNYNAGQSFSRLSGLVTGSKILVLGTSDYLWSVNYYDDRYRVVQNISTNYVGGTDRVTTIYNFTGQIIRTKLTHRNASEEHTIHKRFEYDHGGRLIKTWHKVNQRPEVILSALEYNELGQLVTKKLHASADNSVDEEGTVYSPDVVSKSIYNNETNIIAKTRVVLLPGFAVPAGKKFKATTENQWTPGNSNPPNAAYAQVVDYNYNIRGWMTDINDVNVPEPDLFSMKLNYQNTTLGVGYNQYNGNIGEIIWSSSGIDKQAYGYKYDPMNRLTHANYFNLVDGTKNNRYNEIITNGSSSGYDLNGNILFLQRRGKRADGNFAEMDNLTYNYVNGNQVDRIDDSNGTLATEEGFKENVKVDGEYLYDKNGNMYVDQNKGITEITYNNLNLPRQVTKSSGHYLVYTYDATGRKLRQAVFGPQAKTTDYAGDFFYENNSLKFVNHEEGRTLLTTQVPAYEYFLKDHLGNVRVSFKAITEMTELKTNFEEASNTSFKNYPPDNSAYRATLNEFDHTDPGTTYTRSQRLTGAPGLQIGVSKSYEVMAGDVFDIEVFAKFEASTSTGTDRAALFSALTAAFSLPTSGGTGLESFQARQAFSNIYGTANFIGDEIPYENGTAPKAFLNYILFDENFVFQDFGFDQVDASAEGLSAPHDHMSLHVAVQKKGYLYIFISNENPVVQNVYFDDLKIVRHTYVENVNDYYPFGLAFNSYSRENSTPNLYQFNGKERQDELSLGWDDFGARMYMSEIGRWGVIDPMAQERDWLSPYNFVQNNPINRVDPTGALDFVQNEQGEIYWDKNANSQATTKEGEKYLGKTLTYTFNSAIQAEQWDGPGGSAPIGDKLTSTVQVTGQENDAGELTGVTATSSVKIGETPIGTANDFYPGLGSDQNKFTLNQTKNADGTLKSFSLNFEQHASVSPIEAFGMNAMGYDIVNVAQNLKVNYSGNKVTTSAATDVFPSATLSVNGSQLFHYNQPSFKTTHGRDNRYTDNGAGGVTVEAVSRRPPPRFYQRYKK